MGSKLNRHHSILCRGRNVKLTKDINAIPAGIYRYQDEVDGMYLFSVGRRIIFGVSRDCEKYLEHPEKTLVTSRTSTTEFLDKYYDLLREIESASPFFDSSKPISFCMIDPALAREVH